MPRGSSGRAGVGLRGTAPTHFRSRLTTIRQRAATNDSRGGRRRPFQGGKKQYLQLLTSRTGTPKYAEIRVSRVNHGWGSRVEIFAPSADNRLECGWQVINMLSWRGAPCNCRIGELLPHPARCLTSPDTYVETKRPFLPPFNSHGAMDRSKRCSPTQVDQAFHVRPRQLRPATSARHTSYLTSRPQ
jgi:hypothetical protein